jgi:hypothetical protein
MGRIAFKTGNKARFCDRAQLRTGMLNLAFVVRRTAPKSALIQTKLNAY